MAVAGDEARDVGDLLDEQAAEPGARDDGAELVEAVQAGAVGGLNEPGRGQRRDPGEVGGQLPGDLTERRLGARAWG